MEALLPAPVGAGRFVIRATHERGVGVPFVLRHAFNAGHLSVHAEPGTPDGVDGVGGSGDFDSCRALTMMTEFHGRIS